MKDTTQLEYRAVTTPKSDTCHNADCDGHIEWLEGRDFPKCDLCSQLYCFAGAEDAKAAEDKSDSYKAFEAWATKEGHFSSEGLPNDPHRTRSAYVGWKAALAWRGKPGKIAEAAGFMVDFIGIERSWMLPSQDEARKVAEAINAAHGCEANADAKTIADLESQLEEWKGKPNRVAMFRDFPDNEESRALAAAIREDLGKEQTALRAGAKSDAQTIAMLEGVIEAAKKGAAKGAGAKPKDIAEVEGAVSQLESVSSHGTLRVGGVRFRLPYPMVENLKAAINAGCEEATDGN